MILTAFSLLQNRLLINSLLNFVSIALRTNISAGPECQQQTVNASPDWQAHPVAQRGKHLQTHNQTAAQHSSHDKPLSFSCTAAHQTHTGRATYNSFSLSHLLPAVTILSLLIMSPLCPCPTAKSDGAGAPIVPGSVYQAELQAYQNEHYHNTGAIGISVVK